MGWSTELFCNISFNRKTYNSLSEVESDIEETKDILQRYKDKIKAYAVMTEPDKMVKFDDERYDNLLMQIDGEVSDMLEEMEEYYDELFRLQYLWENWENCHTKDGLAINAPKEITWETAYLDGDFVKSANNPSNQGDLLNPGNDE